jgi:hypothetical protein
MLQIIKSRYCREPWCILDKYLSYIPVVLKGQLDANINDNKLNNYLN